MAGISENIKGICFFDLDGTLLNNKTDVIPDSSLLALDLLRNENYKIVLSTGRDMDTHYSVRYKSIVAPDAIIHHNGTKITVGDMVLLRHVMDTELLHEIYDFCISRGFCMGTSVGGEDFFINPEKKARADMAYNKFLKRNFVPFEQIFERGIEVSALSFAGDVRAEKPVVEEHFHNLQLLPFDSNMGADVVESGFSKAEGMKRICAYYGVSVENTFAFGDSPNDISLLKAAHTGIAMGNADEQVKKIADYVTDSVEHDGIFNACRHLGLIK